MATTLSSDQYATLNKAINLYLVGTAPENQLHVDAIDILAPVAVAVGFSATTGAFAEAAKDRPITTLIQFAAYIGKP